MREHRGATKAELRSSLWDVIFGMLFSNVVMYFIILAAAATLFVAGKHNITTAAEAAQSLKIRSRDARPGFYLPWGSSEWVSWRFP